MKITEIRDQGLSSLIGMYFVCKRCNVVDRDYKRMNNRRPCPRCGLPSDAARLYFPVSALSVMDLIQEFYQASPPTRQQSEFFRNIPTNSHHLAVIIFFCTFFDMLLEHFLRQRMISAQLPLQIQDRLLEDNLYSPQRMERLFPTLTGNKWTAAVVLMRSRAELDYEASVAFYQQVRSVRNRLIHEGAKWIVPDDMPTHCIEHLPSVVNLFAALHNEYCLTLPPQA